MKRILYASGSVLTGDAVAQSVVQYATTLAKVGSADTITIPVVKDYENATVEMLIGPSSQLMLEDAGDDPDATFDDDSFRIEIDERRERVENPPSVKPKGKPVEPGSVLDDY